MNSSMRYSWSILAVLALFCGCDDFLEEDSGDLLIPERVEEYAPMLYSEAYPSDFNAEVSWFVLMTDDVEQGRLEIDSASSEVDSKEWNSFDILNGGQGRQAYTWLRKPDDRLPDRFWNSRYANIMACNLVISRLPEMKYVEQDSGKYNYLAAQAYALRAYHYWCLVNTYALPYSEGNLDKPGVIIRTEPEIDIKDRPRASIREVYAMINDDIRKAEQYMAVADESENRHLITRPAVYLLGSRIALFQENWDEVIRLGELFLKENSAVFDLNTVEEELLGSDKSTAFCIMDGLLNPEVVFTFGNNSYLYSFMAETFNGLAYGLGFRPSGTSASSLLASFEEGDLRRKAWFMRDEPGVLESNPWFGDTYTPAKYRYQYPMKYGKRMSEGAEKPNDKLYHENWRSVEVMLNLAEAYVRQGNAVDNRALELLDRLRKGRFAAESFTALSPAGFSGSEDLVEFIWEERRRELCFEEAMRFWDLRRQGMPQIEHRWYNSWDSYETYVLPEGSANYVLPIPGTELDYNDACEDNVREVINPK